MTSLLINITDESKADDVVRFLNDIPFLEIVRKDGLSNNRIPGLLSKNGPLKMALDFDSELSESFWAGSNH